MHESAPWFVWLILEAVGILFIGSGIPLARRRVAPNPVYGVRFAATLSDERVWYEINAQGGRHFIAIGIVYLVLLNALLLASAGETMSIALPVGFMVAALLVDTVLLYRAARRLASH